MEYHVPIKHGGFSPNYDIAMQSTLVLLLARDHTGLSVLGIRPKLQHQVYVQQVAESIDSFPYEVYEVIAVGLHTGEHCTLWARSEQDVSYPTVATAAHAVLPLEALTKFVYQLLQHVPAGVIRKAVEDAKSCDTFDGSLYAYAKTISEIVSD